MIPKKYKSIFLIIIIVIILTLSFYNNFWNIANNNWFNNHQRDSESLVVGRLYKSQIDGITSQNGLLGKFYSSQDGEYKIYKNSLNAGDYSTYVGQIGLQGIAFSILDNYTNFNNEQNLKMFWLLNSFLLSLVLAFIMIWLYNEFGISSFIVVSLTTVFSQWITVFGRNLYWSIWIMFLPMLICIYLLYYEDKYGRYNNVITSVLIFISIFIKSSSGYEYISTILISLTIPYFYYFIKNKWANKIFIKRFIVISLSSLSGFFMAMFVHILQLKSELGSYNKAIDSIIYRVLKRTSGDPNKVNEVYRASLESNVLNVINKYLENGKAAINLTNLSFFETTLFIFEFKDLIFLFLVASVLVFASKKYFPSIDENRNKFKALTISVWISFLAPLSWFVLAKGHSYIHRHMNYLLWHIPFTILGFALVGYALGLVIKDLNKKTPLLKNIITILVIVLIAILFISNYISTKNRDERITTLINSSENMIENNNFNIYINLKENRILYKTNNQKVNLDERFFLHIYTISSKVLPTERKKYNFDNLDFNFENHEWDFSILSKYFRNDIAMINMPDYPIKLIRTGQFNSKGRLWENSIELNYSSYQNNYLIPYNLTDNNWEEGINKDGKTILLESNIENVATVQEIKYLVLNNKKVEIQEIQYPSSKWIHVKLKNKIDITKYGYPKKIKVIR
ncbi:hypothetical protein SAMN04515654_12815 [Halanaerobium congolense]|uniref:Uncharacterized protein n=1 Tax=Halanaerobium congolense TaxID=54121 RepID=A0A1G8R1U9_9FIRM|nr:hypothetical protein [Halanaerobium congolense]SDJ10959.1 hypothetical protein SAMN04515654_12815 [Halanaerobium congolense]SET65840.1 hypothetical protein SAMN04515653_12325 [Halanaerobium congolense]